MTIADRHADYVKSIASRLKEFGFRVESDLRNEKIGYKVREAQTQKIPYMLIIGDREVEEQTISVRTRSGGDQGSMGLDEFIKQVKEEIESKGR